jgi:hypothetical protein
MGYGGMPRKKKDDIDWDNLDGLYRSAGAALRRRACFALLLVGILAVLAREAELLRFCRARRSHVLLRDRVLWLFCSWQMKQLVATSSRRGDKTPQPLLSVMLC